MAAGAAARSAPARPAPQRSTPAQRPARRRPAQRRMSGPAPVAAPRGGAVALPRVFQAPFARTLRARTSGVMAALLAGRGWIVLIGVLLVGIVFFNVDLLRMNREIALTAEKSTALKRENARLREQAALLGASQRIQDAAAELGMVLPGAGDVRYLKANPEFDARKAARSIVEPSDMAALPAPVVTEPPTAATPTTTITTDPAATVPETTTPTDPTATAPTTTTTDPAVPAPTTTATPTAAAPEGGAVAPTTTTTP